MDRRSSPQGPSTPPPLRDFDRWQRVLTVDPSEPEPHESIGHFLASLLTALILAVAFYVWLIAVSLPAEAVRP